MVEVIFLFIQESMSGKIIGNMRDNGQKIKCQAKAFLNGQMVDIIKVSSKMTRDMVKVKCTIQMDRNIQVIGVMANRMDTGKFFKAQN